MDTNESDIDTDLDEYSGDEDGLVRISFIYMYADTHVLHAHYFHSSRQ